MNTFRLEADRIEIIEAFLRDAPDGVRISADIHASHRQNLGGYQTKSVPTVDNAEDILKVVVHIGTEVGIDVFAAWLFSLLQKTNSKHSKINGQELPASESQIITVINAAVGSSVSVSINTEKKSEKSSTED
jgi:hypothetical protein